MGIGQGSRSAVFWSTRLVGPLQSQIMRTPLIITGVFIEIAVTDSSDMT